jgi:hypothetical protein
MDRHRTGISFRLTDRAWYLIAFGTWTACLVVGAIGYNAVTW